MQVPGNFFQISEYFSTICTITSASTAETATRVGSCPIYTAVGGHVAEVACIYISYVCVGSWSSIAWSNRAHAYCCIVLLLMTSAKVVHTAYEIPKKRCPNKPCEICIRCLKHRDKCIIWYLGHFTENLHHGHLPVGRPLFASNLVLYCCPESPEQKAWTQCRRPGFCFVFHRRL